MVRIKGKGPIFMIYQLIDEAGFPMPFSTAVIMIVMKIKNMSPFAITVLRLHSYQLETLMMRVFEKD